MKCLINILFTVIALISSNVYSHDLGLTKIVIEEKSSLVFELKAKLPVKLQVKPPILPERCNVSEYSVRKFNGLDHFLEWTIECEKSGFEAGDVIDLPWNREGGMVTMNQLNGKVSTQLVTSRQGNIYLVADELLLTDKLTFQTALQYINLGIEHILTGLDHLAFVLALFLISIRRDLIKLITAFTVGHSLTLIFAALGYIKVPIPPVEAGIALSIAFVARELFKDPKHRLKHGVGLVTAFGLLHGLGFASAITDIGLDSNHLLLSLVTFNLGVEFGQLIFLFAVISLNYLYLKLPIKQIKASPILAFSLGSYAFYLVFERIANF